MPRPIGRPSRIKDRALVARLLEELRTVPHASTACALAGLPESTYLAWRARGEELRRRLEQDAGEGLEGEDEGPELDPATLEREAPFLEFLELTDRARAQYEAHHLAIVRKGIEGWTETTIECGERDGKEHLVEKAVNRFDPALALRMLQAAFPERYGKREVAITGRLEVQPRKRIILEDTADPLDQEPYEGEESEA